MKKPPIKHARAAVAALKKAMKLLKAAAPSAAEFAQGDVSYEAHEAKMNLEEGTERIRRAIYHLDGVVYQHRMGV